MDAVHYELIYHLYHLRSKAFHEYRKQIFSVTLNREMLVLRPLEKMESE